MSEKERVYFNILAERDGFYKVHPDEEYIRILRETGILKEQRSKKVLDAGCGSGAFSKFLYEQGFTSIVGVDISDKLIEIANKREKGKISFLCGDMLKLPFESNSFDIIFCGASLHHIPHHLDKAVCEFFRVLRSGGKVYFFEPYFPSMNSFLRYYVFSFNRTQEERALNPIKLHKIFVENGFKNFEFKRITTVKHIYYTYNTKVLQKIFGYVRYLVNEHLFPNTFFVGSAGK